MLSFKVVMPCNNLIRSLTEKYWRHWGGSWLSGDRIEGQGATQMLAVLPNPDRHLSVRQDLCKSYGEVGVGDWGEGRICPTSYRAVRALSSRTSLHMITNWRVTPHGSKSWIKWLRIENGRGLRMGVTSLLETRIDRARSQ
jgi:hypothetical protein